MKKLEKAYQPNKFRSEAHALVDTLADYLESTLAGEGKANPYTEPEDALAYWQKHWHEEHSTEQLFKDIIAHSVHVHHPKYIGHQVTPSLPISAMASFVSSFLNNGMANYEMGTVSSSLEKLVVDFMLNKYTWAEKGSGFLTSGGTLANLTALLAARRAKSPANSWANGHHPNLVVYITEEAHYCVERALRVMGFGDAGIIKVPVNDQFKMDVEALKQLHQQCLNQGKMPIAVVASACSTSTGIYDDIHALADFAEEQSLWLHIDGAHGGAAIFSDKHKHLLYGAERADSIIIDAHKMMMVPALCTFALFKNQKYCNSNFAQKAQYLWEKADDEDWYNYGRKTFECTKLMMSIKLYAILKSEGEGIFTEYVDSLYNQAKNFAEMVKDHVCFEMLMPPESNIMCFRYTASEDASNKHLNQLNKTLRKQLLDDGNYYIVQTELNGVIWLRLSIMNPFTSTKIFSELLENIVQRAKSMDALV